MNRKFQVIGLMSGSSLDGLDIALCSFKLGIGVVEWNLINYTEVPFPANIQQKLSTVASMEQSELNAFEIELTQFFSHAINGTYSDLSEIDLIASHGHTVYHLPQQKKTKQLGDGKLLNKLLAKPIVYDFRIQDIQAGGVGTPMAPLADRDLFPGYDLYVNLGGICNVSFIKDKEWKAFDLIPCNQVLNYFARKLGKSYDENGTIAALGKVQPTIKSFLSQHPFTSKKYPKSLDNQEVYEEWILPMEKMDISAQDALASFTDFITSQLAKLITEQNTQKVLITGGGAFNKYLISLLREQCSSSSIELPSQRLISAKEAILIAYAGLCKVKNIPNFLSSVTGASHDVIGGTLIE